LKSVAPSRPNSLTHADVRRLKLVLEAGHSLEELWVQNPPDLELQSASNFQFVKTREHALERLISSIHALEQADSENVRRLSFHTRNLSLEMTPRHLATVLVPFERLQGKALRDDEILIDEGDRTDVGTERKTGPLMIIADNLRSSFNVGAVLRTAECFGVEHVSLAGYTPAPDTDKTAKTSMGTEKNVSWSSDPNVHDVISKAKASGYEMIALETARSAICLDDFKWPAKAALLLGNERFGLDRDVIDLADHIVKIPMHGSKNSLNVGIACGIALAHWRSQLDENQNTLVKPLSSLTYDPIGTFHSSAEHPYEAPRQASVDRSGFEGTINLINMPPESLKDLEGFERIWLIYDFHHNKNWKPLVLPPRGPHEKRGVFATRSPYRPNSVGLSCVELVRIEKNKVVVRATDLLDGTPIIDIKPYLTYADSFPEAGQGWLEELDQQKFKVNFSKEAQEKLLWLEVSGTKMLRGFLQSQLEFDPLDSERKRVSENGDHFCLAYRTWRADFRQTQNEILVFDIRSGYSANDLDEGAASYSDRHLDKPLHRQFIARFGTSI
jgi:tRNA-Thr(GGU) m(6)t(6)A37 methyltransferase TsaA